MVFWLLFMDAKTEQLIELTSGKLHLLRMRPTAVHYLHATDEKLRDLQKNKNKNKKIKFRLSV
jgi:hypothetical protein